jgi:hypothetical protein
MTRKQIDDLNDELDRVDKETSSSTETITKAMQILAEPVLTKEVVISAVARAAAERIEELLTLNRELIGALRYVLDVCPPINNQGEEAHEDAFAVIKKAKGL